MSFIAWIVVGAIAGFVANLVMGSGEGLVRMVLLGIIGAVAGGYVAQYVLKVGTVSGINIESIVIATAGAIVVVFLARLVSGRRSVRVG